MPWPFTRAGLRALVPAGISVSPGNSFALNLFEKLAADRRRNVFISPASIIACLRLLREGAVGETRAAIDQTLAGSDRTPDSVESVLDFQQNGIELIGANSLWVSRECRPLPEFIAVATRDHKADVFPLDPSAVGVAEINSWVSQKTHGKIQSVVNQLDPLISLLALNAIYFKGLWLSPFEPGLKGDDTFRASDGKAFQLPFMSLDGSLPYYEEPQFQAVRLDYRGLVLSMYVFLPAESETLESFLKGVNSSTWQRWMKRFEPVDGFLRMPKFELSYDAHLRKTLEGLGMGVAFDPQRARFDRIHPPPPEIYLSDVVHRAFIQVNEEGTEAAAFTGAVAVFASEMKPRRTFKMLVNRPFFFGIGDSRTGKLLFLGTVKMPESIFEGRLRLHG